MKISFFTKAKRTVGTIPGGTFFYFKGNPGYVYLKLKHQPALNLLDATSSQIRILCLKTLTETAQNPLNEVEVLGPGSILSLEIE